MREPRNKYDRNAIQVKNIGGTHNNFVDSLVVFFGVGTLANGKETNLVGKYIPLGGGIFLVGNQWRKGRLV